MMGLGFGWLVRTTTSVFRIGSALGPNGDSEEDLVLHNARSKPEMDVSDLLRRGGSKQVICGHISLASAGPEAEAGFQERETTGAPILGGAKCQGKTRQFSFTDHGTGSIHDPFIWWKCHAERRGSTERAIPARANGRTGSDAAQATALPSAALAAGRAGLIDRGFQS